MMKGIRVVGTQNHDGPIKQAQKAPAGARPQPQKVPLKSVDELVEELGGDESQSQGAVQPPATKASSSIPPPSIQSSKSAALVAKVTTSPKTAIDNEESDDEDREEGEIEKTKDNPDPIEAERVTAHQPELPDSQPESQPDNEPVVEAEEDAPAEPPKQRKLAQKSPRPEFLTKSTQTGPRGKRVSAPPTNPPPSKTTAKKTPKVVKRYGDKDTFLMPLDQVEMLLSSSLPGFTITGAATAAISASSEFGTKKILIKAAINSITKGETLVSQDSVTDAVRQENIWNRPSVILAHENGAQSSIHIIEKVKETRFGKKMFVGKKDLLLENRILADYEQLQLPPPPKDKTKGRSVQISEEVREKAIEKREVLEEFADKLTSNTMPDDEPEELEEMMVDDMTDIFKEKELDGAETESGSESSSEEEEESTKSKKKQAPKKKAPKKAATKTTAKKTSKKRKRDSDDTTKKKKKSK